MGKPSKTNVTAREKLASAPKFLHVMVLKANGKISWIKEPLP